MLTISTIECSVDDAGGAAAPAEYVLNRADRPAAFARGDYYTADHDWDTDGPAWFGAPQALSQLGVAAGELVERDALVALLKGQHAVGGEQVRRPGSRIVEREPGSFVMERVVKSVDLTFSVPKSVSVVWSQADAAERRRIEADVLAAAQATIDFMAKRKACVHRRNDDGERYREPAAGVAAALSLHVTARQADADAAPAPQLHVHGVVLGLLRRDGMVVTPDPWAWYRDGAAREGGAYGRAVLAQRLADRGYAIECGTGKKQRYFEIQGVPTNLISALSGRSREVATRARALELATGRPVRGGALAVLAKETRAEKREVDHAEVASWWDALAQEHGLRRTDVARLRSSQRLPAVERNRAVVETLMARLAAEGPTLRTAEARAIAYEAAAGQVSPDRALELLGELQDLGLVVTLEGDRVTTRPIRELEKRVLRVMQAAAGSADGLAAEAVAAGIHAAEGHLGPGRWLDDEQVSAVASICANGGWVNLTGRAGTGKGPVLAAVAAGHRHQGRQVFACAVDGTTATRLGEQVQGPGYTIDGLLARVHHGRIRPHPDDLLIVDEASKVDTARWAELSNLVESCRLRLLAVGDVGQLQSIELPGLFAELCERGMTLELTQVRRHRDPTRPDAAHPWLGRYQALLHAGHGALATALLQEHGALRLHDTRADAMVAMVDDWNTWRHDHEVDQAVLIVHGTNGDVDTVNVLAQRRRLEAGELADARVRAPDHDYDIHGNDVIVLRGAPLRLPGGGRIENGTTMTVAGVDPGTQTISVRFSTGAGAQCTANIDVASMRTTEAERRPSLRLAYAMHPNPAQGATVDRTAALAHPIADRNATYVGDTRARFGHTVYLAREDLGTEGTDEDRVARYSEAISSSRSRAASIRYRAERRDLRRDF